MERGREREIGDGEGERRGREREVRGVTNAHTLPSRARRRCDWRGPAFPELSAVDHILRCHCIERSWEGWVESGRAAPRLCSQTPDTWAKKLESFERRNSIRETNGNFDSCKICLWPISAGWHLKLNESKFTHRIYPFETFDFFAHVSGVSDEGQHRRRRPPRFEPTAAPRLINASLSARDLGMLNASGVLRFCVV